MLTIGRNSLIRAMGWSLAKYKDQHGKTTIDPKKFDGPWIIKHQQIDRCSRKSRIQVQ
jgi:hypothetical protein